MFHAPVTGKYSSSSRINPLDLRPCIRRRRLRDHARSPAGALPAL